MLKNQFRKGRKRKVLKGFANLSKRQKIRQWKNILRKSRTKDFMLKIVMLVLFLQVPFLIMTVDLNGQNKFEEVYMNLCKKCAMKIADALINLVVTVVTLGFYHKNNHKEV